ncbi:MULTISPECIES: class II aldolase/adducin family protein [Cysteiniphilum]|uniref:class II aldolase/adducin family protein n=1 Tax=Cysteiniphilum TaxID=2056696 RepID=UPI000E353366|nr:MULTISPECIES: class II aldolase/adducin family protein [Cysteiniphilum]
MRFKMTDLEQQLREDLAASHHVVYHYGWDDLLATHLSVRIPQSNAVLITPHNVPFEEVSAENLVKVDLNGRVLSQNSYTVMPQAFNIHAEIYKASSSIHSAMHTHSTYGVAVSSLKSGLLFCNQQALRFYNDVAYHDYNGLALANEGHEIVQSLQDKKVMILRNHGLLTTGKTIYEALYLLYYLEKVCELQIKLQSVNDSLIELDESVCLKTKAQFERILTPEKEFAVLKRRVQYLSQNK